MDFKIFIPLERISSHLSVCQVGYHKCPTTYSYGPVVRDYYVMHVLVRGGGEFRVGQKTSKVCEKQIFVTPPGVEVKQWANKDNPFEYYFIAFNGLDAGMLLKSAGFFVNQNYVVESPSHFEILNIVKEMFDNAKDEVRASCMLLRDLYSIMTLLIEDGVPLFRMELETDSIKLATDYINENYSKNINVNSLAEYLKLHRSYIYKMFMKAYNISPKQYIDSVRLDIAISLIRETEYSIKNIAYKCGYEDAATFCRLFKKKFAKTPMEIRNLYKTQSRE